MEELKWFKGSWITKFPPQKWVANHEVGNQSRSRYMTYKEIKKNKDCIFQAGWLRPFSNSLVDWESSLYLSWSESVSTLNSYKHLGRIWQSMVGSCIWRFQGLPEASEFLVSEHKELPWKMNCFCSFWNTLCLKDLLSKMVILFQEGLLHSRCLQ